MKAKVKAALADPDFFKEPVAPAPSHPCSHPAAIRGLAAAGVLLALISAATADELALANGSKLVNITISRAEPDGLVIMTEAGIQKLAFAELSPELRTKYGYDPQKAAAFAARVKSEGQKRMDAELKTAVAEQNAKIVDQVMDETKIHATLTVVRFQDGGAFCTAALGLPGGARTDPKALVYVRGLPDNVVNDDTWEGVIYMAGHFVQDEQKYRAFSTDKQEAARMFRKTFPGK